MKNEYKKNIILLCILFSLSGCGEKIFTYEKLANSYTPEKITIEKEYTNIDITNILKIYRSILKEEFEEEVIFYGYRDKLVAKYMKNIYTEKSFPETFEYEWNIECEKNNGIIKTIVNGKKVSYLKEGETFLEKETLDKLVEKAENKIKEYNNDDVITIEDYKEKPEIDLVFQNKIVKVNLEKKENILDFKEDIVDFEEFEKISIKNKEVDKTKLENIIKDTNIKEENLNKIEPLPELKIEKGE